MKIILSYAFLTLMLLSCTKEYTGDASRIVESLESLSEKTPTSFVIIESDTIEILNGGLPPYYYEENYGESISSIADEDIVIIESKKRIKKIQVIAKSAFDFNIDNPNNITLTTGDILFIKLEGMNISWTRW